MGKLIGIGVVAVLVATSILLVAGWTRLSLVGWKNNIVTIGDVSVHVEYARTADEQRVGLMDRKSLGDNEGMLFVFAMPLPRSFWNQNTLIPLDVIWIRGNAVIGVSALPSIDKGLTIISSPGLADRVLEVTSGFARRHGIVRGTIVK
jgi:hypothetical protein